MKYKELLSSKRFIISTAVLIVAVLIAFLWRDLHLDKRKNIPIPDIVVINLDLKRKISGKDWHFKSPRTEHKNNMLFAESLDIVISEPDSTLTYVNAEHGTFSRISEDITLTDATGRMEKKDKKYFLKARNVFYKASNEVWYLSQDVALSEDKISVNGPTGVYDTKNGKIDMPDGGTVTWSE